jgi:hypothetical protein
LLFACGQALAQGSFVSSATDGFSVPTAYTAGPGQVTLGLWTVREGDDRSGYCVDVGVRGAMEVFVCGVLDDGDLQHNRLGVKRAFLDQHGLRMAAFVYDIRGGVAPKPGVVMTYQQPDGPIGISLAAWHHNDDGMQGGAAATYALTGHVSLAAEYSSTDKLAGGLLLSYGRFSGLAYWLDAYDDLFLSLNDNVFTW